MPSKNSIVVYEHEAVNTSRGACRISETQLKALQAYYGESGTPYYSLTHNGVKFCEYVGVLQIGNTTIEVLPKADKNYDDNVWREVLINMLRSVGAFNINAPSNSNLSLKHNSILDLYFELFVNELEYLVRVGLIKKYRTTEGNVTALKGSIKFAQHVSKNLVHKERFYVSHTHYTAQHLIHQLLNKALRLLKQINTNVTLDSRIGRLLLDFPEQIDLKITEAQFDKLHLDRKSEYYKNALEISKLLLLNYHPDLKGGNNNVLALMFDMNNLWEQFVYVSLRKYKTSGVLIKAQKEGLFWKPRSGYSSKMRPDIVIELEDEGCVIIDTKWKNLNGANPSPADLRQMYTYLQYFDGKRVALIYPGSVDKQVAGNYYIEGGSELGPKECSLLSLTVNANVAEWQKMIAKKVLDWAELNSVVSL